MCKAFCWTQCIHFYSYNKSYKEAGIIPFCNPVEEPEELIHWLEKSLKLIWHPSTATLALLTPQAWERVISLNIVTTKVVFVLAVLGALGGLLQSGQTHFLSQWEKLQVFLLKQNAEVYFCRLLWSHSWTTPWNRKPQFLPNVYRMGVDNILHKTTAPISAFKSAQWWTVWCAHFVPE